MDLSYIATNLADVKNRIARAAEHAGRDPAAVTLVAVSKTRDTSFVRAAIDAGQTVFGENYVQELIAKAGEAGPGVAWHLIGHLQTNKVKKIVGVAGTIQSIDRADLAVEIEKRAAAAGSRRPDGSSLGPSAMAGLTVDCLIEVNLAGELSKTGCPPGEVPGLVNACRGLPHIRLRGLMCIPPFLPAEEVRPYFKKLRELGFRITNEVDAGPLFADLSMGMSGDFEAAVEEGATIIRVGTAIFGER